MRPSRSPVSISFTHSEVLNGRGPGLGFSGLKRHLVLAAVVGSLTLSCATSESGRSGNAIGAQAVPILDPEGRAAVAGDRQPTQDELASAFDAPSGTPARLRKDGTGNVPVWEPSPDPLESQRSELDAAFADLRHQIKAKNPEAVPAAASLVERSKSLGPSYEQRARELHLDAAVAAKQRESIARLALAWLRSCGPERADVCRRKALAQLNRNLRHAPDAAALKKQATAIAEADACLRRAEKDARSGKLPGCLEGAARDYRRLDDDRMVARVHLARARALVSKEATRSDAAGALEKAVAACAASRCNDLQRAALQQLAELLLRQGDEEGAARAALREVALNAAALGAAQRTWAWTELASRSCQALDEAKGEGRCRKLERQLNGAHAFRDFSQASSREEGLSMETVREVNAHFGFTLQPCLAQQAARLVPPAEERYEVRWVVRNDGRVIDMNMGRKDRQESPLAACLREKLAGWRYPRYQGEYQHVEQQFLITARAPLRAQ